MKTRKTALNFTLITIAILSFIYVAFSFITWEFNPGCWKECVRAGFVLIGFPFSPLISAMVVDINKL